MMINSSILSLALLAWAGASSVQAAPPSRTPEPAPQVEVDTDDPMPEADLDAASEMRLFDPAKADGLKAMLRKLHRPTYGWFYGLDAALGSWKDAPAAGAAPMTYNLNRALPAAYWNKALTPGQPDLRESLFIYSDKVDAWMRNEVGIPLAHPAPNVVMTPPVMVAPGYGVHFAESPQVDEFIKKTVRDGGPLTLYLPVNATAFLGAGHYILAVARVAPQPHSHGREYRMTVQYYDSLMSGRSGLFRQHEERAFGEALRARLGSVVGEHALLSYHRNEDVYHQVRSQMPGTTHCGRYVTLYTFAHLMGIPYREWYQERFNLVLPDFMRVFEGR